MTKIYSVHEYMFVNHIYLIYKYKEDLALNNLQRLICHKAKQNQINLYTDNVTVTISLFRGNIILEGQGESLTIVRTTKALYILRN